MKPRSSCVLIILTMLTFTASCPPAEAWGKKKKERQARERQVQQIENRFRSAIRQTQTDGNSRYALLDLLEYRTSLYSVNRSLFDSVARRMGVDYLGDIYFTKIDTILTCERFVDSDDMGILGSTDRYAHYGSLAKKGDILYKSGSYFIGLNTHTNLTRTPGQRSSEAVSRLKGKEIYGVYFDFADEKDLTFGQIFTQRPPSRLPANYSPLTYLTTRSEVSGGILGGIEDFIERNPITATLLAASAFYLLSEDETSSSGSSPGRSSTTDTDAYTRAYLAWKKAEQERVRVHKLLKSCVSRCKNHMSAFTNCYDNACSSQNENYKTAKRRADATKREYARYLN